MKLDKNTLIAGGIGLVVGYALCSLMNRDKTSITFGVDGKPMRMAVRKVYKWNGQGKLYTFSKRTTAVWRETYLTTAEASAFNITGNTENYQGQQYSETTITRDVMGVMENVWVLTTGLLQIG